MNTVLYFFFKILFILIDKGVFPVPPTYKFPTQIDLILKLLFVAIFLIIFIKNVIKLKGYNKNEIKETIILE